MRNRRAVLAAALLTLALAGCSADSSGVADRAPGGTDTAVNEEAAEAPAWDSELGSSADSPGPGSQAATSRQVIITGYLTMIVEDPRASATQVAQIAEAAGGWVEARSERAGTERSNPTASLTVRIPSAALSQSLSQIETLGEVSQLDQSSEDVTGTVMDLDARIKAMETSVERLTLMLENAATTQDVINAEQTLTDRQAQLESLQTQRAYLGEQVAMSTLHVTLTTPADAPPEPPPVREGFWGGILKSWDAMVASAAVLIHLVGILLPWLLLGALVTVVVVALARRHRARNPRPPAGPGWYAGVGAPVPPAPPADYATAGVAAPPAPPADPTGSAPGEAPSAPGEPKG